MELSRLTKQTVHVYENLSNTTSEMMKCISAIKEDLDTADIIQADITGRTT